MGESLESAIEKHYIQWKHLKPWQPKEGTQRHCQQRCPIYEADAHTQFCDDGGWEGHGDWAAHALQVQSITGSTQDRASDLWSRGFLPFWHPWPSGTMYLRAHVSENDKEQSNSFASQGLRVTRQEGAGRKGSGWWRVARGARPCSSCSVVSVTLKPRLAGFRTTCSPEECIWSCRFKLCQGDCQLIDTWAKWCGKS